MLYAGLGVISIMAVWYYRKLVFYSLLTLAGRNPGCRVRGVWSSKAHRRSLVASAASLRKRITIVERDAAGFVLNETPLGRFWTPEGDLDLPEILAEQQVGIYGCLPRQSVRPGDIVLDCGAHVGAFAKTALRNGAKMVVTFEPSHRTGECLRRNLEKEIAAGTVVIVPKGVFDREGALGFEQPANHSKEHRFVVNADPGRAKSLPQVLVTTIDRVVEEFGLPKWGFIKMDVEGCERYALKGASNTLARFKPRLAMACYHYSDDAAVLPSLVTAANPEYRGEFGACAFDRASMRLHPTVYLFQ